MADGKEKKNLVLGKIDRFLQKRPIWAWWISYVVITGGLFGLFYLAFYLLGIKPWLSVLLLITAGIVWGSTKFYKNKKGSGDSAARSDDYSE